jgi:tetratricopeptide (TPR) repeat protein
MEKGWILDRAGRSMPAIECFKRVIEIDPNDPAVYDILAERSNEKGTWLRRKGEALMAKERYADAVNAFDQAVAADRRTRCTIEKRQVADVLNRYDEGVFLIRRSWSRAEELHRHLNRA